MKDNKKLNILTIILVIITIIFSLFIYYKVKNIDKNYNLGYENKLFNNDYVHDIKITINEEDLNNLLEYAIEETYYKADITIDNETYKNVGIRTKGNSSLEDVFNRDDTNKYSLKIEFDHYNDTTLYYGLDKLCLNNIIDDPTYMKDTIVYDMMNYMGLATPLNSYTNVTINNVDYGLYMAVETIEDSFKQRNYNTNDGIIYKPDMDSVSSINNIDDNYDNSNNQNRKKEKNKEENNSMLGADLLYTDNNYNSYLAIFDTAKSKLTNQDKDRMIKIMYNLKNNTNIEDYIDVDNVIKYFVVHNFTCNFDSYTTNTSHNYYLYELNGKIRIIPWDYNLAFGGLSVTDSSNIDYSNITNLINIPIDNPIMGTTNEYRPLWNFILNNSEYLSLYHEYYYKLIREYFNNNRYENLIDKTYYLIRPYISDDIKKSFYNLNEFDEAVPALKNFLLLKSISITNQLNGKISISDKLNNNNYIDGSIIDITKLGYKVHNIEK